MCCVGSCELCPVSFLPRFDCGEGVESWMLWVCISVVRCDYRGGACVLGADGMVLIV